jgi:glyoxylase-like metal-dependent hydrolase (beta-lactamase superfamily II)
MFELNRRSVLTGAVAASAATALTPIATQAAAPPAGKQAPGVYRYKVGTMEVTAVTDGARTFPLPDGFVKNMKKDEVNVGLEAAFMPKDTMTIPFTPIVVNTGSKLVLIDTGNGPQQQANAPVGQLQANLTAAGIDPKAIDTVIISHFHGDHINGLRAGEALAFPNAEVMVPEAEWAFWMDDAKMNAAPEAMKGAFQNVRRVFGSIAGKVNKYGWGKELAPGITSLEAIGHTPGHAAFVVASGSGRMLVQSDVTNIPALFVRNPGWHIVFDMDGPKAEETRRKVFDMAATDKLLVQGFHFPFPGAGYIEKDGNRYRLTPVSWNPVI